MANNRVLIVDDNTLMRSNISALLKQNSFSPVTAKNGVEGLTAIQKHDPALVLLDLDMPEMNGMEMLAMMRGNEATKTLPVMIVTGLTMTPELLKQFKTMGVAGVVTKPFNSSDLLKKIKKIICEVNTAPSETTNEAVGAKTS